MKRSLSRRDFLKLAGSGLAAMAFRPFQLESYYTLKPLSQFPKSEIIWRILGTTQLTNRPWKIFSLNMSGGSSGAGYSNAGCAVGEYDKRGRGRYSWYILA